MQNQIIISNNAEKIKQEFSAFENVHFFQTQKLLLEDAKEIIAKAYISEYKEKYIVIIAQEFGIEAQNALLKILEEPPKNIIFTIIAPSKNVLLPTIRSRLIIQNKIEKIQRVENGLDLTKLDFMTICQFIQKQNELKNEHKLNALELSKLVNSIVCDAIDAKIPFSQEELQYFSQLSYISTLHTPLEAVLTPLLLLILKKQKAGNENL